VLRRVALVLVIVMTACTEREGTSPPSTTTTADVDPELFDEAARDVCVEQGETTALAHRALLAAYDTTAIDMLKVVIQGPDLGILILPQDDQRAATICWYEAGPSAGPDTFVTVGYFESSLCTGSCEGPQRYGPRTREGPPRRA
jgi:hypothetical protein